MDDFLKRNAASLIIAVLGVVASFAVYGYRIESLESRVDTLQATTLESQITLEGIKKDIEYIRLQVDRIVR